jgi:hypothetical protein
VRGPAAPCAQWPEGDSAHAVRTQRAVSRGSSASAQLRRLEGGRGRDGPLGSLSARFEYGARVCNCLGHQTRRFVTDGRL